MSHRHSFNTRPRVRARQKAALERWEERIKDCSREGNRALLETARIQRDILKRKVG